MMTSTNAGTPRIQASRYFPTTFSLRFSYDDRTEHGVCPAVLHVKCVKASRRERWARAAAGIGVLTCVTRQITHRRNVEAQPLAHLTLLVRAQFLEHRQQHPSARLLIVFHAHSHFSRAIRVPVEQPV